MLLFGAVGKLQVIYIIIFIVKYFRRDNFLSMIKKRYLTRKDNLPGLSLHKNQVVTFLGNEVYVEITSLYMNLKDTWRKLIESILFKIRLSQ